jgi:hypothetical protein
MMSVLVRIEVRTACRKGTSHRKVMTNSTTKPTVRHGELKNFLVDTIIPS